MTTTFKLEHRFPDISVEEFERYLNHPELIDMLDAMPAFKSRELVEQTDLGDGKIKWRFKVVAGGAIPPAARKVLNEDMLTWYEDTTFDPQTHCLNWTIEPVKAKKKLNCFGIWKLIPEGEGTRRIIEGSVQIKVPLVGKIAEAFLVGELKKNYDVEPDIQRKFYRKMKSAQS